MNSIVKKTALGALAAATLGLSIAATATPAAAQWRHRHGHGGWGGPVAAGVVGGLAPVSYTHLDVYKRQGRSLRFLARLSVMRQPSRGPVLMM